MEDRSRQASRTRRPSLIREPIKDSLKQGLVRGSRFCERLVVKDRDDDGLSCHSHCCLTHVSGLITTKGTRRSVLDLTRQFKMSTLEEIV
jgi:hypothetical protein